jgi:hypothetical protein
MSDIDFSGVKIAGLRVVCIGAGEAHALDDAEAHRRAGARAVTDPLRP